MIRTIVIASALALGAVSAQAAGVDGVAAQARVYECLIAKPVAAPLEGRAATVTAPTGVNVPRNESVLGN